MLKPYKMYYIAAFIDEEKEGEFEWEKIKKREK